MRLEKKKRERTERQTDEKRTIEIYGKINLCNKSFDHFWSFVSCRVAR